MSLMRWLAVGRSLNSIRDRPSPYKMTQQNLVPRFGQRVVPKVERSAGALRGVGRKLWRAFRGWVLEPWQPVARRVVARLRPRAWKNPFQIRRNAQVVQAELLL